MHWDSITLLQNWAEYGRVGPVRVEWGWGGVGFLTLKQPSRAG